MSHRAEANGSDLKDFKWGIKRGVGSKNKSTQFYESFVYEGVEYCLYDCVYFYHTDHVETSIGKLVKIYEKPNNEKLVKVVWFFRPCELRNFLGDYQPQWNELFLASGVGKGVSNINSVESIIRKCNVVCTSKDRRNPEPSKAELKIADFFFSHTFDAGRFAIVGEFPDEIDAIKVEQFFNRKGDKTTSNPPCVPFPHKKRKIIEEKLTINQSSKSPGEEEFDENAEKLRQDKRTKTSREVIEVTERPDADRRNWFKNMPWDERLRIAEESGTLVLLNNLDPSYTSSEVEDLVWHALKEKVAARMIEWSPTFNKHYGRALVIFKTKDAAESAISELNRRCLILGEGRVVCAKKGTITEPCKQSKFAGHLVLERHVLQKQNREMRNAVSTSHCSQQNTIEYAMATDWLQLYKRSDAWWNALCQKQEEEIEAARSKLKWKGIF